jgi:hypothetical protein
MDVMTVLGIDDVSCTTRTMKWGENTVDFKPAEYFRDFHAPLLQVHNLVFPISLLTALPYGLLVLVK